MRCSKQNLAKIVDVVLMNDRLMDKNLAIHIVKLFFQPLEAIGEYFTIYCT
jgi:hypothetical protein